MNFKERAADLDRADGLAALRDRFVVPQDTIYLDGNSLGLMPKTVPDRLGRLTADEWSHGLIRSWSTAGWFDLPITIGNRIAPIIGAGHDEVAVGESTSVNLFRCMAAGLQLAEGRSTLLVERDNFPTDNYMAQGLADLVAGTSIVQFGDEQELTERLGPDVAVVVLSHVDYRTASVRDMGAINAAAHAAGALVLWDLSHSVGAVSCDLNGTDADLAVGCTYKYLNGGPGSPAFTWINPRHIDELQQPLAGWLGHRDPFAFSPDYEAAPGVRKLVCGTPQVMSLATLDEALVVWHDVDLAVMYDKGRRLTDFFIEAAEALCPDGSITLASPRDATQRGCHVSWHIETGGFQIMQALYNRGVIGDFREPSLMRFGFAPLYLSFAEAAAAANHLSDILTTGEWRTVSIPPRGPGT